MTVAPATSAAAPATTCDDAMIASAAFSIMNHNIGASFFRVNL
jgi:hypothetical protein